MTSVFPGYLNRYFLDPFLFAPFLSPNASLSELVGKLEQKASLTSLKDFFL